MLSKLHCRLIAFGNKEHTKEPTIRETETPIFLLLNVLCLQGQPL